MKAIFKDNLKSYSMIFIFGVIAGLLVVLFCEFPNYDLWSFYYWSSDTFGFWMFSSALIVLCSEKRKNAAINAAIYIFLMFLITTVYMSFRMYWNGYTPFESLVGLSIHHMSGWLLYSIPPAILCGVLGAVLWSGRKNHIYSKILRILPAVFIFFETLLLFYYVFTEHMKLFSAMTDLICFMAYCLILKKGILIETD